MMAGGPKVAIVGAGGHAKVVIEIIRSQGIHEVVACTDMDPSPRQVLGVPVVGSDECLPSLLNQGIRCIFIALGDNALRLRLGRQVESLGFDLINAVSPSAVVSASARIGRGVAVMAGVVINVDADIQDFAIVNTRASIDHDCQIGEAAHVGPGTTLAGRVQVGRLAFIGTGSSAIPGTTIGNGAIVGAGSVVIRDIPDCAFAYGCPAKVIRML